MKQNLFIIGPVASGKNTLLDNLKKKYNINVLDTGQLYRYIAFCIFQKTTINPNLDNLYKNNIREEKRILQEVFKWNRTIEKSLKELEILDGKLHIDGQILKDDSLYSKEVNSIVAIIAKSDLIRKRILQFINGDIVKREGCYALTGHNISEMDTTQFTTIFLDINNEKAAERLYNRNPESYESILEAYKEVLERNNRDSIDKTRSLIDSVYNEIYIDTTELSEDEVSSTVIKELERIEKESQNFKQLQDVNSIDRKHFKWIFNPFLEVIKAYLDRNLDKILKGKEYISKTDLEYQVLIKMCSYKIEELFKGDLSLIREINSGINNRTDKLDIFMKYLTDRRVSLNYELVNIEIRNQIDRLSNLYDNNSTKQIMATLNNSKNKGNILLENIIYKKVDREISQFIARNCHYLHTPRNDEFVSYGAFVEGQALPVAWVSFSKQDREYKKQLLYYLGIEPQNTLEMTRAWCSNSAPQNIMSSLFQYSINEAEQEWKKLKEQREVNKNLQAITTTINPNLGFKASSFMGCNFIPFALRPAKFTYGRQKNATEYMTRREIERNNLDYVENQFNVLPLNEIILCMDKRKQEEISRGKIYTMDKKNYNLVLEGEMNGKDIDSDQKQR